MLHYFLIGITYAFAAVVQPGPYHTYVISQALSVGWRRCWHLAFVPLLTDIPVAILALGVLSNVSEWVLHALQLVGGVFLVFLALSAFKTWRNHQSREDTGLPKSLCKAAAINLLNPNPYLGWGLILGPLVIKGWQNSAGLALSLLIGFYMTMISATVLITFAFSAVSSVGSKVSRTLIGISAFALLLFALYSIWSGSKSLLFSQAPGV